MNTQAELIDWLRDAYAMEKAMETALRKLTDHSHTHQALRDRAALHCTETRQHAEALDACLKRFGSNTSSLKNVLAQGTDLMHCSSSAFARDERLKDVLTVLVTEHFEIACQTILRTGAAQLGLHDIVCICDDILLDERRMTRWLQINLPQIIAAYLSTAATEPEDVPDKALTMDGDPERETRWEFLHLAQNASLFGGQRTFARTIN